MDSVKQANKKITKAIERYKKRLARSLDATTFAIKKESATHMSKVYDNPVPYTLRSMRYGQAKSVSEKTVKGSVYINDEASRGIAPSVYLKGTIQQKRGVKPTAIIIKDVVGANKRLVPLAVRRNKYNNVTPRLYTRIAKALKNREPVNKAKTIDYFYKRINSVGAGLGIIYQRHQKKKSSVIKPMFMVLNQVPKPKKFFDFEKYVAGMVKKTSAKEFARLITIRD